MTSTPTGSSAGPGPRSPRSPTRRRSTGPTSRSRPPRTAGPRSPPPTTATATSSPDGSGGDADGVVAYAYDLADRTIAITPQGATGPTELGLDALGRVATRTTGASTDTLSYLGSTNAVVRIANAGGSGTTTDSLLDAAGSRLGTKVGSADPAWLLPDLHGNTAGAFDAAGGAIVDALRYDGYGLTLAAWNATSNSTPNRDWKYQGRLDLSPDAADDDVASAQPLYDFGAREYSPSAGAFTSLDSVLGSAQAPWQLNRYLYAAANPATLVDPDGHATCSWGPEDCHSLLVAGMETRPYGYQSPPTPRPSRVDPRGPSLADPSADVNSGGAHPPAAKAPIGGCHVTGDCSPQPGDVNDDGAVYGCTASR